MKPGITVRGTILSQNPSEPLSNLSKPTSRPGGALRRILSYCLLLTLRTDDDLLARIHLKTARECSSIGGNLSSRNSPLHFEQRRRSFRSVVNLMALSVEPRSHIDGCG